MPESRQPKPRRGSTDRRNVFRLREPAHAVADGRERDADDPGLLIRTALAAGIREADADTVILAWLFLLPGSSSPPRAAARLLRRQPSRPARPGPGTARLLDLLSFIARYGRRETAAPHHHQTEE